MTRSGIAPSDEGCRFGSEGRFRIPHPVERVNAVLGGWSGKADDYIEKIRARCRGDMRAWP